MKKICMVLVALAMALTASAQFEEGKFYTNASLDGLGVSTWCKWLEIRCLGTSRLLHC